MKAKSLLTRMLTQLASMLSCQEPDRKQVCEILQRIDEQQQTALGILDELETAYRKLHDSDNAMKTRDEADKVLEQVDMETIPAREFLTSLVNKSSRSNVVTINDDEIRLEQQRLEAEIIKEKQVDLALQKNRLREVVEEVRERSERINQLTAELKIDDRKESSENDSNISANLNTNESVGEIDNVNKAQILEEARPEVPINHSKIPDGTHRRLERIRIPVFAGDKMKFQQWNAAFIQVVLTRHPSQFKMLRLEACLTGEAEETIKGLGYSQEASVACAGCEHWCVC